MFDVTRFGEDAEEQISNMKFTRAEKRILKYAHKQDEDEFSDEEYYDLAFYFAEHNGLNDLPEEEDKPKVILDEAKLKAEFMAEVIPLIDNEYKYNREQEDLFGVMDFRHQQSTFEDGEEQHDFEPDCSYKPEDVWAEVWEKYFLNGTAHITPECEAEWEMYYNTEGTDENGWDCGHADTQDAGFFYHGFKIEAYGHFPRKD